MRLKHKKVATLAATLITFGSLAGGANGATTILDIASVTSGDATVFGTLDQLIDQSGLLDQSGLSATYTPGVTDFTSFTSTTTHVNNSPSDAWATSGNSAVLIFDFGSSQTVSEFAFWGDNGSNSSNIDLFTIDISNDPGFAVFTSLGGGNGPLTNSDLVDAAVYDITDGTGRYVRLSANNQGGSFVILGEVAFAGTAIPEPSSALLLGLSALGLVSRRKRTA